jgi:hypothetical protein
MFFELINKSSTFQIFMNDTLMNYFNEFVVTYLNDIIVYSNSKKKHIQHKRKILQRLREANIQINVNKCEFHVIETKFLEMIVKRDEIKMNLWTRNVRQIKYNKLWICNNVKLLYKDKYVNMRRLIVEKIFFTSKFFKYSNEVFESLIFLQIERKTN